MEVWAPVVGYEGLYEASNTGRIKSLERSEVVTRNNKTYVRKRKGRIISQCVNKGYKRANISKDNKQNNCLVHLLICTAFKKSGDHKEKVNHIDGDKLNNNIDNLEWCTQKENVEHAIRIGLIKNKGTDHKSSKLTKEQVKQIRELYVKNSREFGSNALAIKFGVSQSCISTVVRNETYKEVN